MKKDTTLVRRLLLCILFFSFVYMFWVFVDHKNDLTKTEFFSVKILSIAGIIIVYLLPLLTVNSMRGKALKIQNIKQRVPFELKKIAQSYEAGDNGVKTLHYLYLVSAKERVFLFRSKEDFGNGVYVRIEKKIILETIYNHDIRLKMSPVSAIEKVYEPSHQ